jgi:hypothetical protein
LKIFRVIINFNDRHIHFQILREVLIIGLLANKHPPPAAQITRAKQWVQKKFTDSIARAIVKHSPPLETMIQK